MSAAHKKNARASYASIDEATKAERALHGIRWDGIFTIEARSCLSNNKWGDDASLDAPMDSGMRYTSGYGKALPQGMQ